MRALLVRQAQRLEGKIVLLGDKSIAHRCIIVSALSSGKTTIKNFPTNKDVLYTISVFKKLGIKVIQDPKMHSTVTVFGKGLYGLKSPKGPIFVGESGTTFRLILGVLAGQNFRVRLTTGGSLAHRPMLRVNQPLRLMGAKIDAKCKRQNAKIEEYSPVAIRGGNLKPITYKMPVASAQVKSAILLAAIYVKGITRIIEPVKSRDHTERILKLFRAEIKIIPRTFRNRQNTIVIKGNTELVSPHKIYIPGDISSASFFIVLATILSNSHILVRNVSLNPSRIGIIKVLKRMGADIKIKYKKSKIKYYEPVGDLVVANSSLRGCIIKKEEIPSLIDELPILMVAASVASGKTIFKGISELRIKETDRIKSMSENLIKMGSKIKIFKIDKSEHIVITGVKDLYGKRVRSYGDHRTAMSMVVAGLKAHGKTLIDDISCINKSFPDFISLITQILY